MQGDKWSTIQNYLKLPPEIDMWSSRVWSRSMKIAVKFDGAGQLVNYSHFYHTEIFWYILQTASSFCFVRSLSLLLFLSHCHTNYFALALLKRLNTKLHFLHGSFVTHLFTKVYLSKNLSIIKKMEGIFFKIF